MSSSESQADENHISLNKINRTNIIPTVDGMDDK